jgi:dolichol-phosphate mannosyltransferase
MSNNLVVIPAHNEEETIYEVVTRSLKYADVSVTDDGSKDKTADILRRIQVLCAEGMHPHKLNVITHPKATHIPKGIQDGLIFAMSENCDFTVTMDAGMSHDPGALPEFFSYNSGVDIVIGSRRNTQNVPFYRRTISIIARQVVNYALTNSYFDIIGPGIRDCTSGYRRYSKRACKLIAEAKLQSKAFDFHMEALALCCRAGMKVEEIPIKYIFSNSSFNKKVLMQAMKFGWHLISTKNTNTGVRKSLPL